MKLGIETTTQRASTGPPGLAIAHSLLRVAFTDIGRVPRLRSRLPGRQVGQAWDGPQVPVVPASKIAIPGRQIVDEVPEPLRWSLINQR